MTKENLKQEVEEYIKWYPTEGTKDFVVYKVRLGKNAFVYVVEHKSALFLSDWVKMYEGTEQECYRVVGYLDSAESKEKRIEELEEKLNAIDKAGEQVRQQINNAFRDKLSYADLEKENAELKKEVLEVRQHLDMTEREWGKDTVKLFHFKIQLKKAKEHILTLISCLIDWVQEGDKDYCYIADAEQFIKEMENDKQ